MSSYSCHDYRYLTEPGRVARCCGPNFLHYHLRSAAGLCSPCASSPLLLTAAVHARRFTSASASTTTTSPAARRVTSIKFNESPLDQAAPVPTSELLRRVPQFQAARRFSLRQGFKLLISCWVFYFLLVRGQPPIVFCSLSFRLVYSFSLHVFGMSNIWVSASVLLVDLHYTVSQTNIMHTKSVVVLKKMWHVFISLNKYFCHKKEEK